MLNTLRRWHWNLLHRVFGLPDHNHTEPHAPLSVILRSHPPVPAHDHHLAHRANLSLQAQRDREMRRQPVILKSWQQRIGAAFERRFATKDPE
jgi:hypothetical protein